MGAVFPKGIASFTTKRNLLDDVDANDINRLQEEVVALETALGAALNEIQEIESDENGQDTWIINKFKNLNEQITYILNGRHLHAAQASNTNLRLPNQSGKTDGQMPDLVKLDKPSLDDDPKKMWNGTGFTLKADGFWLMQGHVTVSLASTGVKTDKNFGVYQAGFGIGSLWQRGLDRQWNAHDVDWDNVMLNPTILGWYPKGTKVSLVCSQSSKLDQKIRRANLSVIRLRGIG